MPVPLSARFRVPLPTKTYPKGDLISAIRYHANSLLINSPNPGLPMVDWYPETRIRLTFTAQRSGKSRSIDVIIIFL